ncbi:MAG: hypothetical protein IPK74_02535 [Deltaproteobacteria bacterium]|nr:hypothetical protein [Deltaproteobacteria bacterium]
MLARAVAMAAMSAPAACILPFDDLPQPSGATTGDGGTIAPGGDEVGGGTRAGGGREATTDGASSGDGAGGGSAPVFDLGAGDGDDNRGDPPPHNDGECCLPASGSGCGDTTVQDCVCTADPYCCASAWDELCVSHVEILSCGSCDMPGPQGVDVSLLECCQPHDGPGCGDRLLAQCVCASDPFCCDVAWDDVCVDAIAANGCGDCMPPPSDDVTCCTPSMAPGCLDPEIQTCVCAIDAYCCDGQWDELCTDELVEYGCGACDGGGSSSGSGSGSGSGTG